MVGMGVGGGRGKGGEQDGGAVDGGDGCMGAGVKGVPESRRCVKCQDHAWRM